MTNGAEDERMIVRVVRTAAYNTGNGRPEAIDADHIRVHLCANGEYPVEAVTAVIAAAVERGDLVEREDGYVPVDAGKYRTRL